MLQEIKNKLVEMKEKVASLGLLLNLEDKRKKKAELEASSSNPDLWKDPAEAQKLLRELKLTEDEIRNWEGLRAKCEDLLMLTEASIKEEDQALEKELREELKEIEKDVASLEVKTLLSGPYDKNNAILIINAGAGGTDAQDWASILLRMYSRYCDAKKYGAELADISYGEEAGIKSATLLVSAPFAYGYLRTERGIHRLVRISPFNSDKKRQTSFASVEVIPEVSEDVEVKINPVDLRIDTYRASGPGGQHVNKTDSAVRITHIPTGIVTQSQSDRSQISNRETAMKVLMSKLHERLLAERKEKIEELRGEVKDIGWGNQIRSYVFHPYNMVKDHRTGAETSSVDKVIDGDLDMFIQATLRHFKK